MLAIRQGEKAKLIDEIGEGQTTVLASSRRPAKVPGQLRFLQGRIGMEKKLLRL